MRIIGCTHDRHATSILEILNDAITHSTALYDYRPRPPESMDTWFDAKSAGGFPVIGAEDEMGRLAGFATYGTFRAWPAYKYTAEHSVYIHPSYRGKGLGCTLMTHLIERATAQQFHTLIGVIDSGNTASIALHEKLGFTLAGTLTEAGYKFGRWLDVRLYQLLLQTPEHPTEG